MILVEPPGGRPSRAYGPFVDDVRHRTQPLLVALQQSKLGVVVDLFMPDDAARFRDLAAGADIVLEAEPPGRLAASGSTTTRCAPITPR